MRTGRRSGRSSRRRFTGLFVFLAVLSLVVAVVGGWARSVVLDTDRFVATVGPAIEDPDVQAVLSARITDSVMAGLDIEGRVSQGLSSLEQGDFPCRRRCWRRRSPTRSGSGSSRAPRSCSPATRSSPPGIGVLTRAHTQLVAVLRGESATATIEGDAVYVNLLPLVNDALTSLEQRLSEIVRQLDRYPDGHRGQPRDGRDHARAAVRRRPAVGLRQRQGVRVRRASRGAGGRRWRRIGSCSCS